MSVTDAEHAMLSTAVYHDPKTYIPPENYGFTKVPNMDFEDSKTGFYGEVYQRDNDLVIVFRGSDNMLNYEHDLEWLKSGTKPPEFTSAMNLYDMVANNPNFKGFSFSMTGHSLAGSAVQYVDATLAKERGYQIKGVAFAPAGVAEFFPGVDPSSIAVKNYIRDSDKVSDIMNKQLGYENIHLNYKPESYEVQYKDGIGEIVGSKWEDGPLAQHSMLGYWVDVGKMPTRTIEKPIYRRPDWLSYYAPLSDQQLHDMQNIAYLENQSFTMDNEIGAAENITLQIGTRSYRTESYTSDIA